MDNKHKIGYRSLEKKAKKKKHSFKLTYEEYYELKEQGCSECKRDFSGGEMGLTLKKYKRSYTKDTVESVCKACRAVQKDKVFNWVASSKTALRLAFKKSRRRYLIKKRCQRGNQYECEMCHSLVPKIEVDHIDPVVPVDNPDINLHDYAYNLWMTPCQNLCRECHQKKTDKENKKR